MNIKDFGPAYVNLDELKANAKTYEGTFAELKELYTDNKITLVTNSNGDVTGLWVKSDAEDLIMDQLAGDNFNRAYFYKPVMQWVKMILDGEEPSVDEYEVYTACMNELPDEVRDVELSDVSLSAVRNYLKKAYGHCLAKGSQPTVVSNDDGTYDIKDIQWGRKLSPAEMELL